MRVLEVAPLLDDLLAAIRGFSAAPSPGTEAQLRHLRADLARLCLTATGEQLRAIASDSGRGKFAEILGWGTQSLPLDAHEQELITRATEAFAAPADTDGQLRSILALSPILFPHQLPGPCDLALIDPVFHAVLMTALFAEPRFFTAPGDAERHLDWSQSIVARVLDFVRGDQPLDARRGLAEQFARASSFAMTYHNERDLLPLMRTRAAIIEAWLDLHDAGRQFDFPQRTASHPRLRVGLLRNQWSAGSESASCLAHLNGLDRDRFEVFLYVAGGDGNAVEQAASFRTDHFVVLDRSPHRAAARIRGDDLDALLIGGNVTAVVNFTTILSAFRLARKQVLLTLSPATSGFDSIDAYLTGVLNEPEHGQREYTETLTLLRGSINRYDFSGEPVAQDVTTSRAALNIPDDCFVFVSGANHAKLVPDLLEAWARILAATPGSRLVLYPFNPNWSRRFPITFFTLHLRRVFAGHGVDPARLVLIAAKPTRAHVQAVVALGDLYLDSFPYSGAVSVFDPLAVGCPVLALRGRPARARQSAALLSELGVPGAIAATAGDYVAKAIGLFRNRTELDMLKQGAAAARDRMREHCRIDLGDALLTLTPASWSAPPRS